MSIHAFDLTFNGSLNNFPNARAYSDAECTQTARHSNINSNGSVCLGDINTAGEGRSTVPCLGDFLQMLRQCNLDSAYRRAKDFILADPSSVTETQWNATRWEIPGLRRIENALNFNREE
jgi:hypothetical protein